MGVHAGDVVPADVLSFFGDAGPRARAGSANDRREAVTEVLLGARWEAKRAAMFDDPEHGAAWRHLNLELARATAAFAQIDPTYRGAVVVDTERRGGLGNRFDFIVRFAGANRSWTTKLELKRGASLATYPQFLQVYARPGIVAAASFASYPEYLYDNFRDWLEKLAEVSAPSRAEYVKWVVGQNYSRHVLFERLYERRSSTEALRKEIADATIDTYLRALTADGSRSINWTDLAADFSGQLEKLFLMWDPGSERLSFERFTEPEMTLTGEYGLKTNKQGLATSLVVANAAGSSIELLLRWKNSALVLGPAWQIKLVSTSL